MTVPDEFPVADITAIETDIYALTDEGRDYYFSVDGMVVQRPTNAQIINACIDSPKSTASYVSQVNIILDQIFGEDTV
jgi:hypothetical protein